jgi:hypothetical protein
VGDEIAKSKATQHDKALNAKTNVAGVGPDIKVARMSSWVWMGAVRMRKWRYSAGEIARQEKRPFGRYLHSNVVFLYDDGAVQVGDERRDDGGCQSYLVCPGCQCVSNVRLYRFFSTQ